MRKRLRKKLNLTTPTRIGEQCVAGVRFIEIDASAFVQPDVPLGPTHPGKPGSARARYRWRRWSRRQADALAARWHALAGTVGAPILVTSQYEMLDVFGPLQRALEEPVGPLLLPHLADDSFVTMKDLKLVAVKDIKP